MWERENNTASPRSPRPHDTRRDDKGRPRPDDGGHGHDSRKDDTRRRRSRSPRDRSERKRERSRSRERPHRERIRDRRDINGHSRRERSRSRERHQSSRGRDTSARIKGEGLPASGQHSARHEKRLSRSRSPARNGGDRSFRNRSPIKASRSDHDRNRGSERDKPKPPDESKTKGKPEAEKEKNPVVIDDAMAVDEDKDDALLRKMMGFTSFKTTQNTKLPGNQIYGVRKEKKTEYRQYMNRVGGFNRPLSPSR
jgi:U4/U6.U5 tri-snRNP-associated protein 3